jgi:hypothetical protein
MNLEVSRLCPGCGKPIEYGPDVVPLCPECQQRGIIIPSFTDRLDQRFRSADPPWNLPQAVFVLLVFMLTMWFIPAMAVGVWAQSKGIPFTPASVEKIMSNPEANLVGVIAIFGVHLVTLLAAWTVITGWHRRFTDVIDWTWHSQFRLRHAVITVALLYGSAWLLQHVLPTGDTEFDKLLQTSQAIRIAVSSLAVITAPFVEELVYRGILYPAIQAKLGRIAAIFVVAGLFAVVHFMQYWGSVFILVSLTLLSFVLTGVRAYTGRFLPCYVIHFLYNLVGATLILIGYGLAI